MTWGTIQRCLWIRILVRVGQLLQKWYFLHLLHGTRMWFLIKLFHRVLTIFVHVSAVSNSSFMFLFYIHHVLVRSYPIDKSLALFLHVNQAGFPTLLAMTDHKGKVCCNKLQVNVFNIKIMYIILNLTNANTNDIHLV